MGKPAWEKPMQLSLVHIYRQITCELSPGHWVYGDKKCYVITHQSLPSAEEAVFAASDPAALLTRLKGEAGRDIWICGGASVAGQLMKSRLIDEYCISVIPTPVSYTHLLAKPHKARR